METAKIKFSMFSLAWTHEVPWRTRFLEEEGSGITSKTVGN